MEKKPKKTTTPAKKKAAEKKTSDEKPPAKKAPAIKTPVKKPKSKTKKVTRKKKPIQVPPDDLPLSDKWLYYAELVQTFRVGSKTINRWCGRGLLVKFEWDGTIRFNQAHVDWLIEYGRRKFSWIILFLQVTPF